MHIQVIELGYGYSLLHPLLPEYHYAKKKPFKFLLLHNSRKAKAVQMILSSQCEKLNFRELQMDLQKLGRSTQFCKTVKLLIVD